EQEEKKQGPQRDGSAKGPRLVIPGEQLGKQAARGGSIQNGEDHGGHDRGKKSDASHPQRQRQEQDKLEQPADHSRESSRNRKGRPSGRPFILAYSPVAYSPEFSRKARSFWLREGCRSLRSALDSIWRSRSRVTAKDCPTSSRVFSLPSPTPKRIF